MSRQTTPSSEGFTIGRKPVGPGAPAYLIAEIGSNHDGSLTRAKEMITACAKAGADAVKFQSFTADGLFISRTRDDGAWKEHPVWRALKKFELPSTWLAELAAHAKAQNVDFLSTPFELQAVDQLEKVGVPAYKIASGDLTHTALIRRAAQTGKPLLIATGTGELAEARQAVRTALESGNRQIGVFHCVSLYPPRYEEMNLRAVATLARELKCPSGLSDHTPGHDMVLGAIALGASFIEKHVTFDRSLPGPDHPYALLVEEFAGLVKAVRRLESALGDGVKRAAEREKPEKIAARRGLYAARPIAANETITPAMVRAVRPVLGIPANEIDAVVGARAARDIEKDCPLDWKDLERASA